MASVLTVILVYSRPSLLLLQLKCITATSSHSEDQEY